MNMEIWKDIDFNKIGERTEFNNSTLVAPLLKNLLKVSEGALHEFSINGFINDDDKQGETYLEKILSLKGRLIYNFIADDYLYKIFIWDNSILTFSVSGEFYIEITGFSYDETWVKDIIAHYDPLLLPNVQQGHVFAIVNQGGRLALSSIGDAGVKLEEHNYMPAVIEDYKFVVQDLNSEHPSGRISILEGFPGTGKTFLVRGLLLDVPNALFILVSPDMVASLSGPELLPLLMSHKTSHALDGPIIIILEDADKCLVNRGADNISSIQGLLNLGDGIIGSMLDVRIIATTNAKKLELEPAILRKGRLCKRIEVGELDQLTSRNLFKFLCPESKMPDKLVDDKLRGLTLAEVYSMARDYGWVPKEKPKNKSSALEAWMD